MDVGVVVVGGGGDIPDIPEHGQLSMHDSYIKPQVGYSTYKSTKGG